MVMERTWAAARYAPVLSFENHLPANAGWLRG
jgi:hypothetical protein